MIRTLYGKLKLQINEAKSAVGSAFGRKFMGYALWVAQGREVKCKVADKALANFKARVRQLTGRSGGRSMEQGCGPACPVVWQGRLLLLGGPYADRTSRWTRCEVRLDSPNEKAPPCEPGLRGAGCECLYGFRLLVRISTLSGFTMVTPYGTTGARQAASGYALSGLPRIKRLTPLPGTLMDRRSR